MLQGACSSTARTLSSDRHLPHGLVLALVCRPTAHRRARRHWDQARAGPSSGRAVVRSSMQKGGHEELWLPLFVGLAWDSVAALGLIRPCVCAADGG